MSAEQILDNVMRQAVEVQGKVIPCHTNVDPVDSQAEPKQEELASLHANIGEAEKKFKAAADRHTLALAFGIPAFVLSCVLLVTCQHLLFSPLSNLPPFSFYWRIMILWTVVALMTAPIYYFFFRKGYSTAKEALLKEQQLYMGMRLSTQLGRIQFFHEELFRLSSKATQVFFGDEKRFTLASKWAAKAGNVLDGTDTTAALSSVQSYLNSLNELVSREEREQKEETLWQKWAIAVMFLYVGGLVIAALLTNKNPQLLTAEVLGVPLSVILWGAAGSLAAILYRFYTEQGQIRFAAEFRWLVARPIIGIIMGAVVYLALVSGLILVSTNDPAAVVGERMKVFWIISFLAGFSDKFYLGVIDLLVARTVSSKEIDSNTVITQKERIPEPNGEDEPDTSKAKALPAVV